MLFRSQFTFTTCAESKITPAKKSEMLTSAQLPIYREKEREREREGEREGEGDREEKSEEIEKERKRESVCEREGERERVFGQPPIPSRKSLLLKE